MKKLASLLLLLIFATTLDVGAQPLKPNNGESVAKNLLYVTGSDLLDCAIFADNDCVYKNCKLLGGIAQKRIYCGPINYDIKRLTVKDYDDANDQNFTIIVYLRNAYGYSYVVQLDHKGEYINTGELIQDSTEAAFKIIGDDLYAISNDLCWVTRDSNQTWQLDTMGLGSATNYDIELDTFQNVYLTSLSGLYMQPLTSDVWTKITSYPNATATLVFADRRNRIYATTFNKPLIRSTNMGASWQPDTAGLGMKHVVDVADDAFGNIYVIVQSPFIFGSSGNEIYRSDGGTQPYVRIDQPLSDLNANANFKNIFTDIAGDSILVVSGTYGVFKSDDQGDTWQEMNQGVESDVVSSYLEAANGRRFATTNLGGYKANPTDSVWSKSYPQNYLAGTSVFLTDIGTLYHSGHQLDPSDFYNSPRMVVMSTDNGQTWVPDTAGISKIGMYRWYVDEEGNQYAAELGLNQGSMKLYTKKAGQSWAQDNNGFMTGINDFPTAWSTDGNGNLYFSTQNGVLVKRPTNGDQWVSDTDGLLSSIFNLASTSDHKMIAGGFSWPQYKSGRSAAWMTFGFNPYTPLATSSLVLTVDDEDDVWVAFNHFDQSFNSIGDGVYYTSDFGNTWHPAVGNEDTVTFRQLVAIRDTTYGLSFSRGLYLFTKSTSVDSDGDGYSTKTDCNDTVAAINPGSIEIPNNDVDENCDGIAEVIDIDMDGFNSDLDCNDTIATINPGATEIANNGIDEDCDGMDLMTGVNDSPISQSSIEVIPNPTGGEIALSFALGVSCPVSISLLDMQGRELKLLFNKRLNAGSHTLDLDIGRFHTGEYLLVLAAGEAHSTVQLAIVR